MKRGIQVYFNANTIPLKEHVTDGIHYQSSIINEQITSIVLIQSHIMALML